MTVLDTSSSPQDAVREGPERVSFLWLEITGRCQLTCSHCYASSGPSGTHGTMVLADWARVIDQAAHAGCRTVQFIGGEPTLHPALPDLIGRALAAGMAVEVFSNLVHVPAALWEMLTREGVSLACSYYSDDPDEHAAITGRASAHARTRANWKHWACKRSAPTACAVSGGPRRPRATQPSCAGTAPVTSWRSEQMGGSPHACSPDG